MSPVMTLTISPSRGGEPTRVESTTMRSPRLADALPVEVRRAVAFLLAVVFFVVVATVFFAATLFAVAVFAATFFALVLFVVDVFRWVVLRLVGMVPSAIRRVRPFPPTAVPGKQPRLSADTAEHRNVEPGRKGSPSTGPDRSMAVDDESSRAALQAGAERAPRRVRSPSRPLERSAPRRALPAEPETVPTRTSPATLGADDGRVEQDAIPSPLAWLRRDRRREAPYLAASRFVQRSTVRSRSSASSFVRPTRDRKRVV